MLGPDQVDHFKTFGFVVLRDYLTPDEVQAVSNEVDESMRKAYTKAPYDGTRRHWLPLLGPSAPKLTELTTDARFLDVAEQLLEAPVSVLTTDANRYTGPTDWHSDSPSNMGAVKLVLYLEPVGADSGALRVIPGSHKEPLHSAIRGYRDANKPQLAELPAVVCDSRPGDVVVFALSLWHASVGGSEDRRMCTLEYLRHPSNEKERETVTWFTSHIVKMTDNLWGDRDGFPFYDPAWLEAATQDPRGRVLVERLESSGMLAATKVDA